MTGAIGRLDVPELLDGAVDCYVHGMPDLIPRLCDDVVMARQCAKAGLAAAVHRHHYADTTGRARLASAQSGFRVLGALVLGDAVGGLNPTAVEVALTLGAAWVSLPTLSSAAFRRTLATKPAAIRGVLGVGPGRLRLTDDDGRLLDEVRVIVDLVTQSGAVLGLGYGSRDELCALAALIADTGVRSVLTYPHIAGLDMPFVRELAAVTGCYVEICAYRMHPAGPAQGSPEAVHEALALLAAATPRHCVLSSDGGIAGAPPPELLLGWGLRTLHAAGVPAATLRTLVADTPRHLLADRL
jgi:Family of unknown function (DUF6282)